MSGCKKSDIVDENKNQELKLDRIQAYPKSIVSIVGEFDNSKQVYSGTFGSESVEFYLVEGDSMLVFLVPEVAKGNYELIIDDISHNKTELEILENVQVLNADADLDIIIEGIDEYIEETSRLTLETTGTDFEQKKFIEEMIAKAKQDFQQLSDEEKKLTVELINANVTKLPAIPDYEIIDSLRLKKGDTNDPAEILHRKSKYFVVSAITSIISANALVGMIQLNKVTTPIGPFEVSKKVAIPILIATTGASIGMTMGYAEDIGKLGGVPDELMEALKKKVDMDFVSGETYTIIPKIRFRQLSVTDINHPLDYIAETVSELYKFKDAVEEFNSTVSEVLEWLGIDNFQAIDIAFNLEDEAKTKVFTVTGHYFDLLDITNNVDGEYWVEDNELMAKFSSDTETEFSYDIAYKNNEGDVLLTKTITANISKELNTAQKLIEYGPWKSPNYIGYGSDVNGEYFITYTFSDGSVLACDLKASDSTSVGCDILNFQAISETSVIIEDDIVTISRLDKDGLIFDYDDPGLHTPYNKN